jgi:HPt (histidine-containing phosphotransfer) domain-containing protein
MINIYLEETPRLIHTMRQSIDNMDWEKLSEAAHAIIPSFAVIGMRKEYEEMAKRIKDHAAKKEKAASISNLLSRIETACEQAVRELEIELETL